MSDTVTLVLDGKVTLPDFAAAVAHFNGLISALGSEVAGGAVIEWQVVSLQTSSAIATAKGFGMAQAVGIVVSAYELVGDSLEKNQPIPYGPRVAREARGIAALINGNIESVRFETEQRDVLVRHRFEEIDAGPPLGVLPKVTIGAVEGEVETLSKHGGLRFTLYDTLHHKAVSCYLRPGSEEIMRDAWGKRVVVVGRVTRDPATGRPLSVRDVAQVSVVEPGKPGDWLMAIGAAPWLASTPSEEIIRRGRDE